VEEFIHVGVVLRREAGPTMNGRDSGRKVHRESEGDSGFGPSGVTGFPLMMGYRGLTKHQSGGTFLRGVENTPAGDYSVKIKCGGGFPGPRNAVANLRWSRDSTRPAPGHGY
jgi:hypothetical protein